MKAEFLIKYTLAATTKLVVTRLLCQLTENDSELKHSATEYTHNVFLVWGSKKLLEKHDKICISFWYKKFV